MLDGARLTDGKGQTVDMSQTILIFTSNIGVAETMGKTIDKRDRAVVEEHYLTEVERFFNEDLERPEIYNRLKRGVVVFDYITDDIARPVIEERLKQISAGVAERSHNATRVTFDSKDPQDARIVDELLKQTRCSDFGLRDVNNVLFRQVAYVVAELLDNPAKHRHPEWRFRWNEVDRKVELTLPDAKEYDGPANS
jgi:ATP-dependent Clp protease ATP-binding subunit ClpA